MRKEELFRYFSYLVVKRFRAVWNYRTVTRLDVMKMFFFSSVWNISMLDQFWNFKAMINGPVEVDFYNFIYNFWYLWFETFLENPNCNLTNDSSELQIIRTAFEWVPDFFFLKSTNELIEDSHKFESWKIAFSKALEKWKKAFEMEKDLISRESLSLIY
jgi:hypothetical protein